MGVVFSLSSMPKGYMKGWGLYLLASHINRGSLGLKLGFGRARGVHGPKAQLAARRPIPQAGDSGVGAGDSGVGRRLRSFSRSFFRLLFQASVLSGLMFWASSLASVL